MSSIRRAAALFLVLIMLCIPVEKAGAYESQIIWDSGTYEGIDWQIVGILSEKEVYVNYLTVSGDGPIPDFNDPLAGCPGDITPPWALGEGKYIFGITIEPGITRIGNYAFSIAPEYAMGITRIEIPSTVTSIGEGAFLYRNHLEEIVIPDEVTEIGKGAIESSTKIICSHQNTAAVAYAKEHGNTIEFSDLEISITLGDEKQTELTVQRGETVPYQVQTNIEGIEPEVTYVYPSSMADVVTLDPVAKTITANRVCDEVPIIARYGSISAQATLKIVEREYKITYILNGGTNSSENPTVYEEGTTVILHDPTRKGYAFKGWSGTIGTAYQENITTVSGADCTLTANWKKISVAKVKKLKAVNKKSGKAAVSFKKVSGAKGYQIQYATKASFKSKKTKTVTKTKVTLKGLKKKKTYYIRVRAFKKDSAGKKVYGAWSAVKRVKIKK